jgi:hypothetical protein
MQAQHAYLFHRKSSNWFGKFPRGVAVVAISFVIPITSAFAGEVDFEQCRRLFAHGNPPIIQHQ